MKHKAYLTILIIALVGCKPTDEVKFEEAQPESVKPISDFSRNIRGIYTCIENPDKELIIGSDLIQSLNTSFVRLLGQGIVKVSSLLPDGI